MANPLGIGGFRKGDPGGPGRPRRSIERKYLEAVGDEVPMPEWRAVVRRALADAKAGDHQARSWLSKHLIGDSPLNLVELVDKLEAEIERLRGADTKAALDNGAATPNVRPAELGLGQTHFESQGMKDAYCRAHNEGDDLEPLPLPLR
jgi:hypothetical protein